MIFRSSQPLPCLRLGPLKGFFELTGLPSRTLDSHRALLPQLQRYKYTIRSAALGAEVPGHHQEQLTQTLDVRWLKTPPHPHPLALPQRPLGSAEVEVLVDSRSSGLARLLVLRRPPLY